MVVSVVIICVNLGTVIPTLLDTEDGQDFQWSRGKALLIFLGIIYFAIIVMVIKSPTKPEALLDNSCATIEVSSRIF
jgi:hypothetical protein